MQEYNEEWRKSEYFDDIYEISNYGRFKTIDHPIITKLNGKDYTYIKNGHILKLQTPPKAKGYVTANGYKNGKLSPKKIHIVVAKAFPEICGEWFEGAVVDHIDGDKKNNIATNLKVCTTQENNANPITFERQQKIKIPIIQYTKNGDFIKEWYSSFDVEKELGFSHSFILSVCKHKPHYKTAYGYKWEFKNQP